MITLLGIGALAEIVRAEHRPFGSWPYFAVAIPLLAAFGALLDLHLSHDIIPRLAWAGYTMFWFASTVYVVTIAQFGFWFLRSRQRS